MSAIILETPDLDRIWETYIPIPWDGADNTHVRIMRKQLVPLIHGLKERRIIDWYCILIHNKDGDDNIYLHTSFALRKGVKPSLLLDSLPDYFVTKRKVEVGRLRKIADIDDGLLKDHDIREAWRIIGEQSEWFLDMLSIHSEDAEVFPFQIAHFLHYFWNMAKLLAGLQYKGVWQLVCRKCGQPCLSVGPLCQTCEASSQTV